jgi:predicted RNA-binding protein YlxR (DUF448 family)
MTADPVRTCVGCRTKREQRELQRFVRHGDGWTVDGNRRSDGRGVYLCGAQCAKAVVKNKRYPGFGSFAMSHYQTPVDTNMND